MDRRTLLAMGLLFVLFMTWSKVYTKFYGPDPTAADSTGVAQVDPSSTTTKPSTFSSVDHNEAEPVSMPADNEAFAGSGDLPLESPLAFVSGQTGTLIVTTDLFRYTVDTKGGQLSSWNGLMFGGVDTEFVELVPARGDLDPSPKGDVLVFERGELDLTDAVFSIEGSMNVNLGGSERDRSVTLIAETNGGIEVRKTFTFSPGKYAVGVSYEVGTTGPLGLETLSRLGDPVSTRFIWSQGIAVTEQALKAMMRRPTMNRSYAMVGEEMSFRKQGDLDRDDGKAFGAFRGSVRFAGLQNKYFMVAGFVPGSSEKAVEGRIRLGGDRESMAQSWELELPLRRNDGVLGSSAAIYIGPCDFERLSSYDCELQSTVNLGWSWIQPISELVLRLMNWLHKFVPNYGWVIVIISVLSKLIFWPLSAKGTQSMRKTSDSQARLKPQLDALKKKHGKDQQAYNQAMMELYKKEGVNPMAGMAGCLPMLIQMPIFFALYQVLFNMVDLRHAPWIFWIQDLSQPDMLFTLPFSLPLVGTAFNLLPLIMAGATFLQTKLSPQAAPGNQMAMMNNIMPIMMLFFLYNMPSGLVIYWTINTAMTALQSWQVNKSATSTGGAQTT